MKNFSYKGYAGTIEPQKDSGGFFGRLDHINDLVTYEAQTIKELEVEFRISVDTYLESCSELQRQPDIPRIMRYIVKEKRDVDADFSAGYLKQVSRA